MTEMPPQWPPTRRRIYVMRHGDVDYCDAQGKPLHPHHVPLNETGTRQVAAVAAALAPVPLDLVVSSDLPRAEQTARAIIGVRVIPYYQDSRFREIETGKLSDLPPGRGLAQAILGALTSPPYPESSFLGGESFASCSARFLAGWTELLTLSDWQTSLLVAHGIANRLLLCHLLDMPLGSIGRLEQDAACVNLIEIDSEGRPLVRLINASVDDPAKQTHVLTTLEALFQQFQRPNRDRASPDAF